MSSNARSLALPLAGTLLVAAATAQKADQARFAEPVRLKAGEAYAGEGRLYPSPMLQDMNADGLPDLVVGDLFGRVTYAPRLKSEEGAIRYGAAQPVKAADGKDLKFHNW